MRYLSQAMDPASVGRWSKSLLQNSPEMAEAADYLSNLEAARALHYLFAKVVAAKTRVVGVSMVWPEGSKCGGAGTRMLVELDGGVGILLRANPAASDKAERSAGQQSTVIHASEDAPILWK
ncbi:hypothetical protein GCT19_04155 [Paraburkholderia sp. CNPSo 3155]|uniref:hypothetical protein n=1 Tax=Paraburkholderia atlantica TaxID=2654982 RepID=UPI00128E3852|nr:hypothetical protein [Paraburkholderia atlantica]MPW04849.1 hypothetical protein [Paraburkholderia atlantica]